jgi:hypothetical protein
MAKGGATGAGGAGEGLIVDAGNDGVRSQGLVAWYPCEQASGTALPDQSGNNNHATLVSDGTTSSAGYHFVAGKVGSALALSAASHAYATLPAGILAGSSEATIATWIYINSNSNWQRVWHFGKDDKAYMALATTNAKTGVLRFAISVDGNTHDEVIDGQAALPTGVWKHIAVVLGPAGGTLYLDGVQVGENPSMKLRPADLGSTPNNYIGHSPYPQDPATDGNIDEFRIYDRALSPQEIRALFSGS